MHGQKSTSMKSRRNCWIVGMFLSPFPHSLGLFVVWRLRIRRWQILRWRGMSCYGLLGKRNMAIFLQNTVFGSMKQVWMISQINVQLDGQKWEGHVFVEQHLFVVSDIQFYQLHEDHRMPHSSEAHAWKHFLKPIKHSQPRIICKNESLTIAAAHIFKRSGFKRMWSPFGVI